MMDIFRTKVSFMMPVLLVALMGLGACSNPFDPLDESTRIRGLTYVDFSLVWDRWDSDPEGDGVAVSIEYFNEFGDSLSFHDKPHKVVIEFWTQQTLGAVVDPENPEAEPTGGRPSNGVLIFSFPVEHDFTDDEIRIPIEAYDQALLAANDRLFPEDAETVFPEAEVALFVIVRVFPPLEDPQPELVAFYADQAVYVPEAAVAEEGTVPDEPAP